MENKKPHILASLSRLFFGGITLLFFALVYMDNAYEGTSVAMFFGFMIAWGLRWTLLGLYGFARPLPPRAVTYGAAFVLALILGFVGPGISSSHLRAKEPEAWDAVSQASEPMVWNQEYELKIPEPFRRPEFRSRYAEVRCTHALKNSDYAAMRLVADQTFGSERDKYDDRTRATVKKAFQDLFKKGLASVKPTKLADPKMSAAFAKVLDAIASNPTRKIVLHFDARGGVGPIPEDKAFMSDLQPQYAKLPITPVGDAFGPLAEGRRAEQTRAAMQSSLSAVVPQALLAIELAGDKSSPDDVHFQVSADIRRLPGFYVQSSDEPGKESVPEAFLYKMEVKWAFKIAVDNKSLGQFTLASEPAKHVSYSVNPGDPDWAPYSIMMDSAADNFARQVVGKLGLEPPPEKESYGFVPNTPPPAAPATPPAPGSPAAKATP